MKQGITYSLVCAPAGSGLTEAIMRLRANIETQHRSQPLWCDVEETLLKGIASPSGEAISISMRDVTWERPREEVIRLWNGACDEALNVLSKDGAQADRFLSCHLTLYNGRRSEFYSPLNVSDLISRITLDRVLLFVDDIYDMYCRLTRKDQLFEMPSYANEHLQQAWENEVGPGPQSFEETDRNYLWLEAKIEILTRLLSWRHTEMIIAELLARQSGARLMVFGTKQSTNAAARWLLTDQSTVYLSHPISRPRRLWRRSSDDESLRKWHPVVQEFNLLQEKLETLRVIAIMPTAIDELRIAQIKSLVAVPDVDGTALAVRLPRLESRWPLPASDHAKLLYAQPSDADAPEYRDLLGNGRLAESKEAAALLRGLENQIAVEVPFRDHLLVSWSTHMLIYRPLFRDGQFSSGVAAEIGHWSALAASHQTSRVVFVHFDSDLERLAPLLKHAAASNADGLTETEEQRERRVGRIRGRLAQPVEADAIGSSPGLLDKGLSPREQAEAKDRRRHAANKYLESQLTGVVDPLIHQVGVWVLADAAELDESLADIVSFLEDGIFRNEGWLDRAWRVLELTPESWLEQLGVQ